MSRHIGNSIHPWRHHIHAPHGVGERIADVVTGFSGSWRFLGVHVAWWGIWIVGGIEHYPFGLLTMVLSLEAIVLSTLVLMSQSREGRKNQVRDNTQAAEVAHLYDLSDGQQRTEAEILALQHTQTEILHLLRQHLIQDEQDEREGAAAHE